MIQKTYILILILLLLNSYPFSAEFVNTDLLFPAEELPFGNIMYYPHG